MPIASIKGLDLRSPDDRITYRNRVAKKLHEKSTNQIREIAEFYVGSIASTMGRLKAIEVITDAEIKNIVRA